MRYILYMMIAVYLAPASARSPEEDAMIAFRLQMAAAEQQHRRPDRTPPRFFIWLGELFSRKENTLSGARSPRPRPLAGTAAASELPKAPAEPPAPPPPPSPYPQCKAGQYTSDSDTAGKMFDKILNIRDGFNKTMIENIPFTGTRVKFALIDENSSLQVRIEGSLKMVLPAKICEQDNNILVVLDNSQAKGFMASMAGPTIELRINPVDERQFRLSDKGNRITNTYTATPNSEITEAQR